MFMSVDFDWVLFELPGAFGVHLHRKKESDTL